jgi:hypothetical protein
MQVWQNDLIAMLRKAGKLMNRTKKFAVAFFLLFTPFLCLNQSPPQRECFSFYGSAEVDSCDKGDGKGPDNLTDVRPLQDTAQVASSDFPYRDCFWHFRSREENRRRSRTEGVRERAAFVSYA